MTKETIISKLSINHQLFIDRLLSLDEPAFNFSKKGKWNAGETLDHLHRSVAALNRALVLPKQVFGLLFGKANRPSKNYEALVAKYKGKLEEGGKAHGKYLPGKIDYSNRQKTTSALHKAVDSICKRISAFSEEQLDQYILPHPLLGKITIREMLYFTIYHAEHHTKF